MHFLSVVSCSNLLQGAIVDKILLGDVFKTPTKIRAGTRVYCVLMWRIPWIDVHPEETKSQQIVSGTMGWKLELSCIKKRWDLQFSIYTSSACSAPFKCHLTTWGGSIFWWLWSSLHHVDVLSYSCTKLSETNAQMLWTVNEETLRCCRNCNVSTTGSLDVGARAEQQSLHTYQPVCSLNMFLVLNDFMREYVHTDWAIEIVVIAWRIGSVLPARRCRALPEKKCACICVSSFKEIPSAVFIDHHSSRAR